MAVERRKDNRNRVLKEGEYQRSCGTYEFKWRDKRGKRHSISAITLEELREKEVDVLRDIIDGVRADKNTLTVNDMYNSWVQLKKGLKDNTFSNYKYMYQMFVETNLHSYYPYHMDMTIIWGGTLAVLLNRLRRNTYKVVRENYNVEDQIKRIGVYFMCIDDLPL